MNEMVRTACTDALERVPSPRRATLALVRPIVAPPEEFVPAPTDPRAAFESAALIAMRELQRFTFYR